MGYVFLFLIVLAALVLLVRGFRKVPIGASGVVIWLGRRTGEVRPEGITWLPPVLATLETIYRRERQIDIPAEQYYTSDRVRISFKTTLRVAVTDPVALFDQGPGTYKPFSHDAVGGDSGGEEANVSLRSLAQNSIRECVRSMRIEQVLFGSGPHQGLHERIRQELADTSRRWGLSVPEIWLTNVDADDQQVKQALQAEVRQAMEGKGNLAAWKAQIAKGALFQQVAREMVDEVRGQTGREVPVEEAQSFLIAAYQNERALEVATRSASGHNELMSLFYLQALGLPLPNPASLAKGFPLRPAAAAPAPAPTLSGPISDGSFIIGREGDIVVDGDDGVSRQHARLDIRGGRMTLTDLGSTNGTFVGERGLAPGLAMPVEPRERVRFGKTVSATAEELEAAARRGRLRGSGETQPAGR
jgi:regulator of protease activity HflC (stomatin/prohibitin superfamily)